MKQEACVLIVLGPPGSGKGSQANLLKDKLNIPHLSTGDILRKEIQDNTSLGSIAKSLIDTGQLVPDHLIMEMVIGKLQKPECARGCILDGVPRTVQQAEQLQTYFAQENITQTVVFIDIPRNNLIERIIHRRLCRDCQTPYHLLYAPPKKHNCCDRCLAPLFHRKDDTLEILQTRLDIYEKQTEPVIEYYRSQKLLNTIASVASIEEILGRILSLFPVKQLS